MQKGMKACLGRFFVAFVFKWFGIDNLNIGLNIGSDHAESQ